MLIHAACLYAAFLLLLIVAVGHLSAQDERQVKFQTQATGISPTSPSQVQVRSGLWSSVQQSVCVFMGNGLVGVGKATRQPPDSSMSASDASDAVPCHVNNL